MSLLPFQQFASTRISIVNLQIVHNRVGSVSYTHLDVYKRQEEILDFVGKPQSFQEKRTFNKEKKYLRIENLHIQEDCSYIYEQHGAYATYDIIIMTRRKSDWQGIVKKDEEVIGEFKSILELMHLLVVR